MARRGTCASTASPWNTRQGCNASGAPGSGKTSLAVPLAAALGYALLAKDRIKETLHDAFGAPGPDRAWSRRLGGAAMELLWALAADAPAVVIEANFRPRSEYERARLAARPMFARKRDAIEAHLTIVFTALAVAREAQDRTGLAIRNVIRQLRPLRSATIAVNGAVQAFPPAIYPNSRRSSTTSRTGEISGTEEITRLRFLHPGEQTAHREAASTSPMACRA